MSTLKHLFTEEEAAEYLNMSRAYLRQDRMNGALKDHPPGPVYYKIGRTIRYAQQDLDEWLKHFRIERNAANS